MRGCGRRSALLLRHSEERQAWSHRSWFALIRRRSVRVPWNLVRLCPPNHCCPHLGRSTRRKLDPRLPRFGPAGSVRRTPIV